MFKKEDSRANVVAKKREDWSRNSVEKVPKHADYPDVKRRYTVLIYGRTIFATNGGR